MNKLAISLVLILTASSAAAEKITFCVVNDFMQIVTYRGDNEACLEFETPLEIISGEQGPAGPAVQIIGGSTGVLTLLPLEQVFLPMFYGMIGAASDVEVIMPASGAVTNLNVRTRSNVIGTGHYEFFVWKSGSDSTVSCQIPNGQNTCSNTVNCVDFTGGTDTIALRATPSGIEFPTGAGWTAVFHPETTCADLGF